MCLMRKLSDSGFIVCKNYLKFEENVVSILETGGCSNNWVTSVQFYTYVGWIVCQE